MSVLIKGMEMPKNCAECPVNMEVCRRGYKYLLEHMDLYEKRADDCPIVEVKVPHGRLIDADALKDEWKRGDGDNDYEKAWITTVRRSINAAPTIIPAEEGEP